MRERTFYNDNFLRDEKGRVYTEQFIEHNSYIKENHTLTKVENPYEELEGVKVRCNYSQIFFPDTSMLMCNNIPKIDEELFYNEESSDIYYYEDEDGNEITESEYEELDADEQGKYEEKWHEIYQYFLLDNGTADYLSRHTDELIFYSEKLDLYVLGVTHLGTGWDYVGAEFVY